MPEDTGPLSAEQAIATLVQQYEEPAEAEAPIAAAEPAVSDAEPEEQGSEAAATTAEDDASEAAEPGDGVEEAETDEPDAPEVEPPAWWTAEHKARFRELPSDLQAVVREQETTRERLVSEAKERAANAEKSRDEELKGVRTLAEQLNAFLPEAIQTFRNQWGAKEPDWAALSEQVGADEAFKLKARYDSEQKQITQLAQANQAAQVEAHRAFLQAEFKALAEIAPDLAPDVRDPKQGAEKRQAIVKYLVAEGIPEAAISQISAREMRLAHKAMLWDEAQAQLKAAPKPKQPAAQSKPKAAVRPAAAQVQPSTPQRAAQQAANRFAQTRSVDDAVALLLASGNQT